MPRYSGDEAYLRAFGEIVPALVSWFKPDAVVAQIGVDTHYSDPLTSLRVSLQGYSSLVKGIIDLADKYAEGRLLALGGGGYSIRAVPIAWASAFQMMRGKSLYYLSQNWVEMFQLETRIEPISLEDLAPGGRPEVGQWICSQLNEVLSGLKSILHDIHGGHGLTFIPQEEILP
jgi:acetoin utilization protein AcuC